MGREKDEQEYKVPIALAISTRVSVSAALRREHTQLPPRTVPAVPAHARTLIRWKGGIATKRAQSKKEDKRCGRGVPYLFQSV